MSKADRDISKLKPDFKTKVEKFLKDCSEIFVTEAFRSEARQKEMIALGLSKVSHSNHQDGLAVDIGFNGNQLYPTDMTKRRKVADIAKKYGIDRGYDLWKRDKPHFQNGLLAITPVLMKLYEEIYKKENPNGGTVIKDPQGAINNITKNGSIDVSELVYLMLIAIERLSKK